MSDEKPTYTMENPKFYDEEQFYDTEIASLRDKIIELCEQKDIPYLMAFQYSEDSTSKGIAASLNPGKETHCGKFNIAFQQIISITQR